MPQKMGMKKPPGICGTGGFGSGSGIA